ncbi:MAG: DNA/RNA non-specific endonuclease [Bacteroidales bacterium]|nr:DNA/RNA non-specific endonuclease [Bacteroidales bacterium]
MKHITLLLAWMFAGSFVSGQEQLELPAEKPREEIVRHQYYTLSFVEGYELASWVAYELTAEEASGSLDFKEKYTEDPLISTGSATRKDYKKSGYVPGQLAPVEDMRFSEAAVTESFYLSNVVPQKLAFNKYTWRKINDIIREWAKESGSLLVAGGPVLADAPFPAFGPGKVSIPSRFYKVVLDIKGKKGMGIVVKNSMSSGSLKPFAMSIDKVEEITGIDFFHSLPDDLENEIESQYNDSDWNFEIPDL